MIRAGLTVLLIVSGMPPVVATAVDVPSGYRRIAAEYSIPSHLFYAVALTESGKRIDGTVGLRPWPWTLNIKGEPQFFERRYAAERALQRVLAAGEDLVDVGLMQVNWRYHRRRLREPRLALDPYHNLRVAARILRECHIAHGDWWAAVGCYHAPLNARRAASYRARVARHWRRLMRSG